MGMRARRSCGGWPRRRASCGGSCAGRRGELPALTEETELTAAPPFDELYRHYVEAQVHYANGETARYNSAAGLWNNAFLTYRDYRARTAVPEGGASALRLC